MKDKSLKFLKLFLSLMLVFLMIGCDEGEDENILNQKNLSSVEEVSVFKLDNSVVSLKWEKKPKDESYLIYMESEQGPVIVANVEPSEYLVQEIHLESVPEDSNIKFKILRE